MSETVGIGPFKKGLRRRKQKLRLDESEEAEKRIASQQKIFKPHPGRQGVQQPWTPRQAILGVEMTIKKKTKQKKKQNKIKYYSEPRMGHVYARSLATSSALNNWKWAFNQRKVKLSLEYFLFAFLGSARRQVGSHVGEERSFQKLVRRSLDRVVLKGCWFHPRRTFPEILFVDSMRGWRDGPRPVSTTHNI